MILPYAFVPAMSSSFDVQVTPSLCSAMVELALRCTKVSIGAIKELHVKMFFESLLAASWMSEHVII